MTWSDFRWVWFYRIKALNVRVIYACASILGLHFFVLPQPTWVVDPVRVTVCVMTAISLLSYSILDGRSAWKDWQAWRMYGKYKWLAISSILGVACYLFIAVLLITSAILVMMGRM